MNVEQIPLMIIVTLLVIEIFKGTYTRKSVSPNDWIINILSFLQENLVRPLFALGIALTCAWMMPDRQNAFSELPFWPTLIAFFFLQDFVHYWYHRLAHQWEPLWNIHRVHHSPKTMGVIITSRINFLWQLLMPVNYISGIAIYLGQGEVFLVWWVFRACLNYLTHTDVRWDLPFYRIKSIQPIIWLIEHVFTTPDAHHAHHGYGEKGNPMGNYAPVMIFWDHVFGTAKLPHSVQDHIGIKDDPVYPWYQQLWWPIFKFNNSKQSPVSEENTSPMR